MPMLLPPSDEPARDDDARRRTILSAAGDVFLAKGFLKATTLEIARTARVSKRDLYRLFGTKQGILMALVHTNTAAMDMPTDLGQPDSREEFLDALQRFGRRFLAELLAPERSALYRLAIAEATQSNEIGLALRNAGAGRVVQSVTAFVTHAIGRGLLAAEDAALVMEAYFGTLIGQTQIRVLMGTDPVPDAAGIEVIVSRAVEVVRRLTARSG